MVKEVLPDALANPLLDGGRGALAVAYWGMACLAALVIASGTVVEWRRCGREGLGRWLLGVVALSGAAYCVSFVAGERWPSYRTAWALTSVWTVFLVASLANLSEALPPWARRVPALALGTLVAGSAYLAHQHTFELFARPQNRELALLREGAHRAAQLREPRLYVVTANQGDSWAPLRYGDEFGSVTVDAPWLAREAMQVLMRQELGPGRQAGSYQVAAGPEAPAAGQYDLVVDMRQLRGARP